MGGLVSRTGDWDWKTGNGRTGIGELVKEGMGLGDW